MRYLFPSNELKLPLLPTNSAEEPTFKGEGLKSGGANREVKVARSKEGDREITLGIRIEIALFRCALAVDHHCRTCYRRSTGVADGASYRSRVGSLAMRGENAERKNGDFQYVADVSAENRSPGPTRSRAGLGWMHA